MYKVEVIADNSGIWAGNGLMFETETKAEKYAKDLMSKWALVQKWRVVPVTEEEFTRELAKDDQLQEVVKNHW